MMLVFEDLEERFLVPLVKKLQPRRLILCTVTTYIARCKSRLKFPGKLNPCLNHCNDP
jgi:hypothetical protein